MSDLRFDETAYDSIQDVSVKELSAYDSIQDVSVKELFVMIISLDMESVDSELLITFVCAANYTQYNMKSYV